MKINVEWFVTPKSGLTDIDLADLDCADIEEWNSLSKKEQKKRLTVAISEYDGCMIVFNPVDWGKAI